MQRVVVIGGGIIGLTVAWALERRGCRVTLLEGRTPGHGASAVNAGWICPALSDPVPAPGVVGASPRWLLRSDSPLYVRPRADPDLLRWLLAFRRRCNARDHAAGLAATAELNRRTMALYDELAASGVRFELHRDGLLFAYRSPRALEHDLRAIEPLAAHGIQTPAALWGDAARELEPALSPAVVGGFWLAGERHVRPESLTAGLVEHLSRRGVAVGRDSPVTAIEHDGGRVRAVRTGDGRLPTDAVVVCAGAWTPSVLALAGIPARRVPIQAGKGYSLDFAPPPHPVGRPIYLHEARVAVTPLAGMVRLAGTMEFSGLDERVRPERVAAIARTAALCLRDWPADPSTARIGTGLRPMTPDGLPLIGAVPGFRNLAVASGHAMLGITLAPATAEAIADLLTTGRTAEALRPFDPGRFGRPL